MTTQVASDLGFLGVNVDSGFDLAWLKTEVINKFEQGDRTSAYKLLNFARHSEDEAIRTYANNMLKLNPDLVTESVTE